jgi:hypothetical protein
MLREDQMEDRRTLGPDDGEMRLDGRARDRRTETGSLLKRRKRQQTQETSREIINLQPAEEEIS